MSNEEDCGAWVQFSEIGICARMRNALELYELRSQVVKELPAALGGIGGLDAAGLASEDAKTHDGEKLVKRA